MKKLLFLIILLNSTNLFSQNFWVQTNGPFGGCITGIVVQPNGDIFCGTGFGGGVYKSTNNGNNWMKVFHPEPANSVNSLTKDKYNNLYAGTNNIYKSTDGGNTWQPLSGTSIGYVQKIAISSNGYIFAGIGTGIYRSTNNGVNWTLVSPLFGYNPGFVTIAENGDVYLGLIGGWVRKSTNNGNSWNDFSIYGGGVGMAIDSSGNLLIANYFGIYKSSNNGTNWQVINNEAHFVSISVLNNNELYAGSGYNEIYKSSDNGLTWNEVYNTSSFAGWINDFARMSNGYVLASTVHNGVQLTTNGGLNWSSINDGITNQSTSDIIYSGNGKIYCGSYYDGMYVTTNRGDSWTQIGLRYQYIFAVGAIGDNCIFAYTGDNRKLYRTSNSGINWELINSLQGIMVNNFITIDSYIFAGTSGGVYRSTDTGLNWAMIALPSCNIIKLDKDTSNYLYAVTDTSIYRSTDFGSNWLKLSVLPSYGIRYMSISPYNNYFYLSTSNTLYRSTNNGTSWNLVNDSIYFRFMICNTEGDVFGYYAGPAYRSTDYGITWEDINSGLLNYYTNQFAIDDEGYLYISTSGSGVLRSTQSTISVQNLSSEIPEYFSLYQNYPNPFNPVTKIKFSIPLSRGVSEGRGVLTKLIVYDILGREITTLVNEQLIPGTYEVEWDGSNYTSEVYFYKLITQDYFETRKMVLIK